AEPMPRTCPIVVPFMPPRPSEVSLRIVISLEQQQCCPECCGQHDPGHDRDHGPAIVGIDFEAGPHVEREVTDPRTQVAEESPAETDQNDIAGHRGGDCGEGLVSLGPGSECPQPPEQYRQADQSESVTGYPVQD